MISEQLLDDLEFYMDEYSIDDLNMVSYYGELGHDPIIYTYGTTPFSSFKKVIDSIRKPKRIVVLGSSIGWKCFYWNSIYPDIPAVGYEIHEIRHDYACYLGEKHGIENVSFICEDMSECDFREGDLVWENNLTMDIQQCDSLNYRILSSIEDIQIVSYSPILRSMSDKSGDFYVPYLSGIRKFERRMMKCPSSWSQSATFFFADSLFKK